MLRKTNKKRSASAKKASRVALFLVFCMLVTMILPMPGFRVQAAGQSQVVDSGTSTIMYYDGGGNSVPAPNFIISVNKTVAQATEGSALVENQFVVTLNVEIIGNFVAQVDADAVVTDTLPEFLHFNEGSFSGNNGAVESNGVITWMLADASPSVNVNNGNKRFSITYGVTLDNLKLENVSAPSHNMNDSPAIFRFSSQSSELEFNIPTIKSFFSLEIFLKKNKAQEDLLGAVFALYADEGPEDGALPYRSDITASDGRNYFQILVPSGHKYMLKETTAPAGYEKRDEPWSWSVKWGESDSYRLAVLNRNIAPVVAVPLYNEPLPATQNIKVVKRWIDPVTPVMLEEPVTLEALVDSDLPIDSDMTADPEVPTDPDLPIDSGMTVDPEVPTDPDLPIDSDMTVDPEAPTDSELPSDSDNTGDSEAPTDPDLPIDSDMNVNPDEPTAPESSNDSDVTEEPETPADAAEPNDSAVTEDTDVSDDSALQAAGKADLTDELTLIADEPETADEAALLTEIVHPGLTFTLYAQSDNDGEQEIASEELPQGSEDGDFVLFENVPTLDSQSAPYTYRVVETIENDDGTYVSSCIATEDGFEVTNTYVDLAKYALRIDRVYESRRNSIVTLRESVTGKESDGTRFVKNEPFSKNINTNDYLTYNSTTYEFTSGSIALGAIAPQADSIVSGSNTIDVEQRDGEYVITLQYTSNKTTGGGGGNSGGGSGGGSDNKPTTPVTPPVGPGTPPVEPETPAPVIPPDFDVDSPHVPPTDIGTLDPNLPDSPDSFVRVDENDVPLGYYTKQMQADGSFIYIDENGVPLGGFPTTMEIAALPKTGENAPIGVLLSLGLLSFMGLLVLTHSRHRMRHIKK